MSKATTTIEGLVSKDPEIRNAGQHRVAAVSVPHTPRKQQGNEWVDAGPTTWFEAEFWNEHADAIVQQVRKGDLVTITGAPEIQVYAKRDGEPGGKVLLRFPVLGVVVRRPRPGDSVSSPPVQQSAPTAGDVWGAPGAYSDDTPF